MAKNTRQAGYGIIGLGRFGATLARTLAELGQDVLVVDSSEAKIREARSFTDAAFVTGSLDRETLMEVGIQNCDTVAVCIGERIDTSILTTLTVKQLGVRRVLAKAISADQGAVLEKLGAEVIYPESDMAVRLAKKLTTKRLIDFLPLGGDVEVTELQLCEPIAGKTVAQADLRGKYGLNIIAIIGPEGTTIDFGPSHLLRHEDMVVVIGKRQNVEKLEAVLGKNEQ